MKEYTVDELMEMDAKTIHDVQKKMWDIETVVNVQNRIKNPISNTNTASKFTAWDKKEIIIKGICPVVAAGLLATGIYAAVKYYVDETFVQEDED